MPADLACDGFWHPGAHEVAHGGAAQIVEEEPFLAVLRDQAGLGGRVGPRGLDALHAFSVVLENPRARRIVRIACRFALPQDGDEFVGEGNHACLAVLRLAWL